MAVVSTPNNRLDYRNQSRIKYRISHEVVSCVQCAHEEINRLNHTATVSDLSPAQIRGIQSFLHPNNRLCLTRETAFPIPDFEILIRWPVIWLLDVFQIADNVVMILSMTKKLQRCSLPNEPPIKILFMEFVFSCDRLVCCVCASAYVNIWNETMWKFKLTFLNRIMSLWVNIWAIATHDSERVYWILYLLWACACVSMQANHDK